MLPPVLLFGIEVLTLFLKGLNRSADRSVLELIWFMYHANGPDRATLKGIPSAMARKADPDRKNNIVQSAIPAFAQKGYAAARIVDAVHLDRVKRKSCPLPKAMQA